jgi:hypothetical protein
MYLAREAINLTPTIAGMADFTATSITGGLCFMSRDIT